MPAMENDMEFKKNPDLIEKPNHAHYPTCRGRLDAIKNISQQTLFYTLAVSGIMALLSLLAVPLHVVGWIPLMFTLKDTAAFEMGFGFSMVQMLMCLLLSLVALIGCTRYKICTVIVFFVYALMLVFSAFVRLTMFDFVTLIIGGGGVFKSFGALKGYADFKQLRRTEGYPMFSAILTEYDEKKKENPDGFSGDRYHKLLREKLAKERNISQGTDASGIKKKKLMSYAQPVSAETDGFGEMPELTVKSVVRTNTNTSRFKPKGVKEGDFSDSPLKNSQGG